MLPKYVGMRRCISLQWEIEELRYLCVGDNKPAYRRNLKRQWQKLRRRADIHLVATDLVDYYEGGQEIAEWEEDREFWDVWYEQEWDDIPLGIPTEAFGG